MNDDDNNFPILYIYFKSGNMINYRDSFSFSFKIGEITMKIVIWSN